MSNIYDDNYEESYKFVFCDEKNDDGCDCR